MLLWQSLQTIIFDHIRRSLVVFAVLELMLAGYRLSLQGNASFTDMVAITATFAFVVLSPPPSLYRSSLL